MSAFEITGHILSISQPQTFPSGFSKREFVLKTNEERYPQELKFDCIKDKASLLDKFSKGDEVTVHFNLRGSEYNGRHYVNLHAWKNIAGASEGGNPNSANSTKGGSSSPASNRSLSSLEAAFDSEPDPATSFDEEPPF